MKAMTLPLFVFLIGMSICSFAQKQPDAGAVIKILLILKRFNLL